VVPSALERKESVEVFLDEQEAAVAVVLSSWVVRHWALMKSSLSPVTLSPRAISSYAADIEQQAAATADSLALEELADAPCWRK